MREHLFSITKKDFEIQFFSGKGAGGQHRNRHKNCVRLFHPESGVRVTGQSQRSKTANLREAFKNMINHPKFKVWMNLKIREAIEKKTIEEAVKEAMREENLKIEVKGEDGQWIEI